MENHGSDVTSMSSAVHGPGYSGNTPLVHVNHFASGGVTDFHVYAVEWDSVSIRFFVDDVRHFLVPRGSVQRYGNWVFDHDPQSGAIFPATNLVDYVRVYQKH